MVMVMLWTALGMSAGALILAGMIERDIQRLRRDVGALAERMSRAEQLAAKVSPVGFAEIVRDNVADAARSKQVKEMS